MQVPSILRGIPASRLRSILWPVTFLYLAFPVFLFLGSALRPAYAVLSLAILGGLSLRLVLSAVQNPSPADGEDRTLSLPTLAGIFLIAATVTFISGVSCGLLREVDWLKHFAILRDLIVAPWPVGYRYSSGAGAPDAELVYYIAYYIPAALLGKWAGWDAAQYGLIAQTFAGIWLIALWLASFVPKRPLAAQCVFWLFSGLSMIAFSAVRHLLQTPDFFEREEWGGWLFAWNFRQVLQYGPQHALTSWLVACLVFDRVTRMERQAGYIPLGALAAILALWSPFALLGGIPFVVMWAWRSRYEIATDLQSLAGRFSLAGEVFLLLLVGLYFISRIGFEWGNLLSLPPEPRGNGLILLLLPEPRLIWLIRLVLFYPVFCLLEFGLLAGVLWMAFGRALSPVEKKCLAVAVTILAILPFFRYGYCNDLVDKASAPAQAILCFVALISFARLDCWLGLLQRLWRGVLLVLLLELGMILTLWHQHVHLKMEARLGAVVQSQTAIQYPAMTEIPTLRQLQNHSVPEKYFRFLPQYIGSPQSFFFRHLARRVAPVSDLGEPLPENWREPILPFEKEMKSSAR